MESDKELLRQGRYIEALGQNYNPKPWHIVFTGKSVPEIDQIGHVTYEDAMEFAKEMNLPPNEEWCIFNSNADWL